MFCEKQQLPSVIDQLSFTNETLMYLATDKLRNVEVKADDDFPFSKTTCRGLCHLICTRDMDKSRHNSG